MDLSSYKRKNSSTQVEIKNSLLTSSSSSTMNPLASGAPLTLSRLLVWCLLGCTLMYLLLPVAKEVILPSATSSTSATCTPHAGKPPAQYALILDAGSTGSRIHVYKFNYCKGASPSLETEIFMQVQPGLSSFPDDPNAAAASLNPLLERALAEIPSHLHSCTPMALKATAGLRLLGDEKSTLILMAVRSRLVATGFPIADLKSGDGVAVMDGSDEGVFAWITVNYLTQRIGGKRMSTSGVMDLGGGSTQIVFEPIDGAAVPNDPQYRFGHDYVLYQHSYLNYGLMEGRKRLKTASAGKLPCLKTGVSIEGIAGDGKDFSTCKAFVAKELFSKTDTCSISPCSFDGIHQPKLTTAFPVDKAGGGKLYAFSYFYDKTWPYDLKDRFTVGDIGKLGEAKCAANAVMDVKDQDDLHLCMDLGFIYSLLSVGYELPAGREMEVLKKIDGFETGWCLGSAIQLIDSLTGRGSDLVCKA